MYHYINIYSLFIYLFIYIWIELNRRSELLSRCLIVASLGCKPTEVPGVLPFLSRKRILSKKAIRFCDDLSFGYWAVWLYSLSNLISKIRMNHRTLFIRIKNGTSLQVEEKELNTEGKWERRAQGIRDRCSDHYTISWINGLTATPTRDS